MKIHKQIILTATIWAAGTGVAPLTSQTVDKNYVLTRTMTTDTGTKYLDRIDYFDGLGRPEETVQKQFSPTGKDIVTYQEYDGYNRSTKTWLPAVTTATTGNYIAPASVDKQARSTYGDEAPYHLTTYENNPLRQIAGQYGPGKQWHTGKKAIKTSLSGNTTVTDNPNLACGFYQVAGTGTAVTLTRVHWYAPGELSVTSLTDEVGNVSYEFTDKTGQVVLKRQLNGTIHYDTYFVYDLRGNLCFVLPPLVSNKLPESFTTLTTSLQTGMDRYGYQYLYDVHNRCIGKKLPGCAWNYYVYDKADRLIFSQDGEQRKRNEWAFAIPDRLGRVAVTGICKNTLAVDGSDLYPNTLVRAKWSNTTGTYKGYTIQGVTLTSPMVLQVNYYDNYEFMGKNSIPAATNSHFKPETLSGYGEHYAGGHQGLHTGSWMAHIHGNTTSGALYKVMYYDSHRRLVQVKANNHLAGGIDKEYLAYNFTGQVTKRRLVHSATGKTTQTETYSYTYDKAGRLSKKTHKLNALATVVLEENTYDETGRLKTTATAGQSRLKRTYTYNVRSWLTQMQSTFFKQNLTYNMNGNIKTMNWEQASKNRTYTYTYDKLNRLRTASFTGEGDYKTSYTYDRHGNIKTLRRYGNLSASTYGLVDSLTYTYTGNQLKTITDNGPAVTYSQTTDFKEYTKGTATEYTYNTNGAMTKDLNKGISSIQYNCIHLPHIIDLKNKVAETRNTYTYAADGTKLSLNKAWNPSPSSSATAGSPVTTSALTRAKKTDYVGNKVYEDGVLKTVLVDGGYYDVAEAGYCFYIKDHLGNNRIVIDPITGNSVQNTRYYPFGTPFGEGKGSAVQPYKYNGKEFDTDRGLNLYDYHARQYDPITARFLTMDPLAEKYYSISPYAYCLNNPTRYIDLNGKSPGDVVVAFAGADFLSDGGLGATPQLIQMIQPTLDQYGGVAQAFKSQLWGTDFRNPGKGSTFDKATQEAFEYVLENHNMHNGEQVEGGRIFIQGYSYGGVMANHLAKRLQEAGLDVELLITVDAAASKYSDQIDRTVPSNVKTNINYFQTKESGIKSKGDKNVAQDETKTNVYNINISNYGEHGELNEITKSSTAYWLKEYLR
ncbi:MAG: DUF6443 domain-containing protein, partial [Tannerellaceae bacterium]|nr:DUF6443 domain-containing protein [Tannerellaceae bacterium]